VRADAVVDTGATVLRISAAQSGASSVLALNPPFLFTVESTPAPLRPPVGEVLPSLTTEATPPAVPGRQTAV